LDLGIGDTLV